MRKLYLLSSLLIIVALCFAFDMHSISVSSHTRLEPPLGAVETDSLPVADAMPREAIVFTFPDSFLLPTTAIIEAQLVVKIVPNEEVSRENPLQIFCIPLTASPASSGAFSEITEDLLNVSEVGIYEPDSGTVFFEIGNMLQQAAAGEISFRGIALVPAKNCPSFRISHETGAINLKCAYAIGKREVTEH